MKTKRAVALMLASAISMSMLTGCNKSKKPAKGDYSLEACQTVIDNFFTACKEGNVDDIIEYSDNTYYIENALENKDAVSQLFKYMFSDLVWEFGLDQMDSANETTLESFESNGAMSFHVAYAQSYWKYLPEAYIYETSKTQSAFYLPQNGDMYAIMDTVKNDSPLICKSSSPIKIEDQEIKVMANEFFENTFGNFAIFSSGDEPNNYIKYLMNSGNNETIKISREFPLSDEDASVIEIKDNVFDLLKEKKDNEVFDYLFDMQDSNAELADAIARCFESNYYFIQILEASDNVVQNVLEQYNDIKQFYVEYELNSTQRRYAKIYRFYNTPVNSAQYQEEFSKFILNNNAYYNIFEFDAATYSISEPMEAVSVYGNYISNQQNY